MATPENSSTIPRTAARRRWPRFSLRTLTMIVLVLALLFAWVGNFAAHVRRERRITARIQAAGGHVYSFYHLAGYEYGEWPPPGAGIVHWIFGDDIFAYAHFIAFLKRWDDVANQPVFSPFTDADLEMLADLPFLEGGRLEGPLTDRGLAHLARIRNLRILELRPTAVPLQSFSVLGNAPKLAKLWLIGETITDSSLPGIERCQGLTELGLFSTKVTDSGLAYVGKLNNLRLLNLANSNITDEGVCHLAILKNLEELDLGDTLVGDHGMEQVAALSNLRRLALIRTGVTDQGLRLLQALGKLEQLSIGPNVTLQAATELKAHLPRCAIHATGPHGNRAFTIDADGTITDFLKDESRLQVRVEEMQMTISSPTKYGQIHPPQVRQVSDFAGRKR